MKKYAEVIIDYDLDRRKFLSGGAVLGASVIAAVAIPSSVAAATEQVPVLEKEEIKEEGYRMTQHIADYYKSASV